MEPKNHDFPALYIKGEYCGRIKDMELTGNVNVESSYIPIVNEPRLRSVSIQGTFQTTPYSEFKEIIEDMERKYKRRVKRLTHNFCCIVYALILRSHRR